MAKLEELTWKEVHDHLRAIASGASDLDREKRERIIAHALVLVMDRVGADGSLRREDVLQKCQCGGTGWITEGDLHSGGRQRTSCPCGGRGWRLTKTGEVIAEVARGGWL